MKVTEYKVVEAENKNEKKEIIDILSNEIKSNEDCLKSIKKTNLIVGRLKNRLRNGDLFPLKDEEIIIVNKFILVAFATAPKEYSKNSSYGDVGKDIQFDKVKIMNLLFNKDMYDEVVNSLITEEDYKDLEKKVSSSGDSIDLLYNFYSLSNNNKYKFFINSMYSAIIEQIDPYKVSQSDNIKSYVMNLKKLRNCFLSTNIISSNMLEDIFNYEGPTNVDFKKTLNHNVIKKYNEEVYKRNRALIQTPKTKEEKKEIIVHYLNREERKKAYKQNSICFKDSGEIELTEEDMVCLELYLEIVTDLENGKIKIEDFENKTANYISYVEGTHYKEILEELIIKIQNSNNISKNIKAKGIKAINALKRTI